MHNMPVTAVPICNYPFIQNISPILKEFGTQQLRYLSSSQQL